MEQPTQIKKPWLFRIVTILYTLLILPSFMLPFGAIFMFDAPGSDNIYNEILALLLATAPITLILASIGGFSCAFNTLQPGEKVKGTIFAWLPIIHLALILGGFELLDLLCQGKFVCN